MTTPALEAQLARLAAASIELVPAEMDRYFLLSRDGFVCLVERVQSKEPGALPRFGGIGSVCRATEQGIAAVVYSGEGGYYAGKGFRIEAPAAELESARRFAADLRAALLG